MTPADAVFMAFVMVCAPTPAGPGTGVCGVSPPTSIHKTMKHCRTALQGLWSEMKKEPGYDPTIKAGARAYGGCIKRTISEVVKITPNEVGKELRK